MQVNKAKEMLGVEIDPELFILALTHRSFANEHASNLNGMANNERLEFLGDIILGYVITIELFKRFPSDSEGILSKKRGYLVKEATLATIARNIGLNKLVLLGAGEIKTGGADKDSILSDTFEAVLGAIYLTHGIDFCVQYINKIFDPFLIEVSDHYQDLNPRDHLLALAKSLNLGDPIYLSRSFGKEHDKKYTVTITFAAKKLNQKIEATDTSKKKASARAAKLAIDVLKNIGSELN